MAVDETRSSSRRPADGADDDDRALLKSRDTEETPLDGVSHAAARPYRRITTLALCVSMTLAVVGVRRMSLRPAAGVASLAARPGVASLAARPGAASKLSGAASLEARSGAMTPTKLSELSGLAALSKKEKKSVREDDDDFHASKKESFSTYSYSYGGDTALLEPGDGDDDASSSPKFDHPPRDLGDDTPNSADPTATPSPTTLLPYPPVSLRRCLRTPYDLRALTQVSATDAHL